MPSVAISGSSKISMGGTDVDIQLVVLDGTLYAALTPNSWLDMGPAAEVYDPSVILNPDTGLANMLSNVTDAKADGFDTIGGVQTVRLTGKVAADAVNKLIPQLKRRRPAARHGVDREGRPEPAGAGEGGPEREQQRAADAVRVG